MKSKNCLVITFVFLMVPLTTSSSNQYLLNEIPLDLQWTSLSEDEYAQNLVACELKIQEYKWSKNLWPDSNPHLDLVMF